VRIERTTIKLPAVVYVANTIVELADMIGAITLHPSVANAMTSLCCIGKSIAAVPTLGRASRAQDANLDYRARTPHQHT
jgi:hypothetical protein